MATGPVQALVIGFEEGKFEGEILAELARLEEHEVVRLLDLLLVRKDAEGNVEIVNADESGITDLAVSGDVAKALLGDPDLPEEPGETEGSGDIWYVADAIPNGGAAGIALLEHVWAIPLREAIGRAGGELLAAEWLHPTDVEAIGAAG